jgi:hypothetical protein
MTGSVTDVLMWSQNTKFSIKLLKYLKYRLLHILFIYKCSTFRVNMCPSLQTNIYMSRSFSVWGVIPVLSVGAYFILDHCVLLECTVTHEKNYRLTNLTRRTVSGSKDTSTTLIAQCSAINHTGCERH